MKTAAILLFSVLAAMFIVAIDHGLLLRDVEGRIERHERDEDALRDRVLRRCAERPLVARQVVTNLVRVACRCGVCDAERGIAVPEHMNVVGFDLAVVVQTNYLPVVLGEPENGREASHDRR